MNLIETPQSIVPGQSEIDCWPQLKRAIHPCNDKCSNFKDEQRSHCLLKEIENQEFNLGLAPDANYVKTENQGCEHHPKKCCECLLLEIDAEYLSAMSDEEKFFNAAIISINEVS